MEEILKSIRLSERGLLLLSFATLALGLALDPVAEQRAALRELEIIDSFRRVAIDAAFVRESTDAWYGVTSLYYSGFKSIGDSNERLDFAPANGALVSVAALYYAPFLAPDLRVDQLIELGYENIEPLGVLTVPTQSDLLQLLKNAMPERYGCHPCVVSNLSVSLDNFLPDTTPSWPILSQHSREGLEFEIVAVTRAIEHPLKPTWWVNGAIVHPVAGVIELTEDLKYPLVVDGLLQIPGFRFTPDRTGNYGIDQPLYNEYPRFPEIVEEHASRIRQFQRRAPWEQSFPAITGLQRSLAELRIQEAIQRLRSEILSGQRNLGVFGVSVSEVWAAIFAPAFLLGILLYIVANIMELLRHSEADIRRLLESFSIASLNQGVLSFGLAVFSLLVLPGVSCFTLLIRLETIAPAWITRFGWVFSTCIIIVSSWTLFLIKRIRSVRKP